MTRSRMDDIDALERLSGGAGYDLMTLMYSQHRTTSQLNRTTIQYLYRKYGILKKLVNVPANQMTFRWGYLQLGGKDGDAEIREQFDRITKALPVQSVYSKRRGLATAFNAAQKAANKGGNGAILLDVDDGGELDEPINYKRLKSIKNLFILNRWAIQPLRIGSTTDHEFYRLGGLAATQMLPINLRSYAMQSVHRSRVLWFRGEELDDDELAITGGCDDSVFESILSSFFDYQDSICGAKQMIKDFDVFIHKLNGLIEELMNDGDGEYERTLEKRIHINSMMRRIHGTQMVDMENEELTHSTRTVTGYSDLMARVLDNFLANTELTPAELLGKYPEGMADTGKTEQQNANDRTSRYQSEKFQSNIMDFCHILFSCKDGPTKGKVPEVYDFVFNLLYPVTPPEQAELQLNYAQINDINIRNQVYTADDVAKSQYGGNEFNPNIVIDFKAREKAKDEAKAQAEAQANPAADPNANANDIEALLQSYQTDAADPTPRLMPPQEVQSAARQGLAIYKEKNIKSDLALTPLALRLSMGYPIESHEVQQLRTFFMLPKNRKVARQSPSEGFGAIVWAMMGGDAGDMWSGAIARELDRRKPVEPRTDDDTPIKKAINWNGYQIGLQYLPLDMRHERILPLGYGEFLGLISEHDGMNADVYVGPDLECDRVFAITQLDYETGLFDEVKFIIGVDKPADEVANLYKIIMTPEHFGGIEEIEVGAIGSYEPKTWIKRADAIKAEHVALGVGAAAAVGAGAYLLSKGQKGKKPGKPCGEGHISADLECHIGESAESKTPRKSFSEHFIAAPGAMSAAELDEAFARIKTEGVTERLNAISDFLSRNDTKIVSVTAKTQPEKVVKLIRRDSVSEKEELRAKALHIVVKSGATDGLITKGYTSKTINHVVVFAPKGHSQDASLTDDQIGIFLDVEKKGHRVWSVTDFVDVVLNRRDRKKDNITYAVNTLHEIGHVFDFKNNLSSRIKETAHPVSEYGSANKVETFAEAFALWTISPKTLKKLSPDLHELIEGEFYA